MRIFFVILLTVFSISTVGQKNYKANWKSIDTRPVPEWFVDAKFGVFVHWGLYSVPSWGPTDGKVYDGYSEWYWMRLTEPDSITGSKFIDFHNRTFGKDFRYQDFASQFKAELFNPTQWADVIEKSGAKYVVLTSKHHDGFALWPSKQAWNWNSVDVGPHRDIAGELTEAVKKKGLHMGFYYSLYEWFNPLYQEDVDKYVDEHMLPQMKDLVERYQPEIFWTDGEWGHSSQTWRSPEFLAWLYNESAAKETVVVNDRWGEETRSKHGDFFTTEYDLIHHDNAGDLIMEHPWEETRGIGGSFGYNRNENLENYESSEFLIRYLINKVARGGNLLLNIGPTADGRIPVIQQKILKDMGDWLEINGEAIYGTRSWKDAPAISSETTQYYTAKGSDLYLIVTRWSDDPIPVALTGKVTGISMLGYEGEVDYKLTDSGCTINPPVLNFLNSPSSVAWVYKISGVL